MTLFTTITIGSVTLRNRTAVAPMTRLSAGEDGLVTDRMVRYYEEFARGGWGLIETDRQCLPGSVGLFFCAGDYSRSG